MLADILGYVRRYTMNRLSKHRHQTTMIDNKQSAALLAVLQWVQGLFNLIWVVCQTLVRQVVLIQLKVLHLLLIQKTMVDFHSK